MKSLSLWLAVATTSLIWNLSPLSAEELTCFELRTYHPNEGKLEALHTRFRDHTVGLFEKHGMTQLAYWVPVENKENVLVYLLGYPDKAARETAWKAFRSDPDWQQAYKASTADGKLVNHVDSVFLHLTDYSPKPPIPESETEHLFEMREYTCNPGKLENLDARFRDHTIDLFEKHGLTNLLYFHLDDGQEGSENTLLYFLAHASDESKSAGFKAFSADPEWKAARDASEADGKILVKQGVQSTPLKATDYSPVK
ncbi:NIPSNAP family protein [Verrucomicrobiales bacterium BCK34]|nr:NIPSNAP family protein [Verrucomicrobiales bacterium BCK34]